MSRILVIEDNEAVREEIAMILQFEHFSVQAVGDGRLGVEAATAEPPDLVLCDLMMPQMNGYETLAALREVSSTATVPFVFLTARSERADLRKGMELGADDYLTKPVMAEELLAAVRAALAKKMRASSETEAKLSGVRDRIAATLPHELQTPLTTILGYGEIMQTDAASIESEEVAAMARQIVGAATRLHRLTENFVLFAQLELLAQRPEGIHLADDGNRDRAADLEEVARRKATEAGRSDDLRLDCAEGPAVAAGAHHFRKMIEELVDNAFKFSERGSHVLVKADVADGHLVVQVTDNGRGLSAGQIEAAGPYVQFDRERFEQQGMGLGLAVTRRLAELYGGSLGLTSVPGQGTTVTISLPIRGDSRAPACSK